MTKLALVLLILTAPTLHADYIWPTSVWEQMESGSLDPIHAKIKQVELRGASIIVTIDKLEPGEPAVTDTFKICTNDRAVNDWGTEADRAMAINLRVQSLREAKKSKETVELGHRGPWHPCVWPLAI